MHILGDRPRRLTLLDVVRERAGPCLAHGRRIPLWLGRLSRRRVCSLVEGHLEGLALAAQPESLSHLVIGAHGDEVAVGVLVAENAAERGGELETLAHEVPPATCNKSEQTSHRQVEHAGERERRRAGSGHAQGFVGVAFVEDDSAERVLVLDLDDIHACSLFPAAVAQPKPRDRLCG